MNVRQQLLDKVRSTPEGVAMRDLIDDFPDVSRRTLQRAARQLVDEQLIRADGAGANRRYFAIERAQPNDEIVLSTIAQEVLTYVTGPRTQRAPVGYLRDFVESYVPNDTYYLSRETRHYLRSIGSTGTEDFPAGTYGRAVLDRLLIDLSWASSHLEGNTYNLLDTRKLIERGQVAEGKDAQETQMILNHKSAIELLVDNADAIDFDRHTLLNLHAVLSFNLLPNPQDEGRLRMHPVAISGSVFMPLALPALVAEMFTLVLAKAREIEDPYEQAFFAMVHLPYLQPFADVNKRTSRLTANIPLLKRNLIPLTFIDVPRESYAMAILGVYELTRVDLLAELFVWAYERSTRQYRAVTQELAEPNPLRLVYGQLIKDAVHQVVTSLNADRDEVIAAAVAEVPNRERDEVFALIVAEISRLHEGVLSRYRLRPSEFQRWRDAVSANTR